MKFRRHKTRIMRYRDSRGGDYFLVQYFGQQSLRRYGARLADVIVVKVSTNPDCLPYPSCFPYYGHWANMARKSEMFWDD